MSDKDIIDDLDLDPDLAELEDVDLEAEIAAEVDGLDDEGDNEETRAPRGFDDEAVRLGDREFEIGEPDVDVTLRILNAIGRVGVRGEKVAARLIQHPSSRSVVFGMLAVMTRKDLELFALALCQLDDTKDNRKWIASVNLRIAPLVKAFFLNYSKSSDLREALANFFVGQEMLESALIEMGL